jgi:hypothetical protein
MGKRESKLMVFRCQRRKWELAFYHGKERDKGEVSERRDLSYFLTLCGLLRCRGYLSCLFLLQRVVGISRVISWGRFFISISCQDTSRHTRFTT